MNKSQFIFSALLAAVLFGSTTPLAKQLLDDLSPTLLAGLLYFGSGCGLLVVKIVRDRGWRPLNLSRVEYRWLSGAILFGGVIAPVCLLIGLLQVAANSASLLLNLEAVFTALMAWLIFKENASVRIVVGMLAIVIGGIVLAWPATEATGHTYGPYWIAAACLCWAIDNNLTRKVSANDVMFIAGSKGLTAGIFNTALAVFFGALLPGTRVIAGAMLVGFLGYGVSLALFVFALRGLGTSRSAAYFSVAPFIGALVATVVMREPMSLPMWLAGAFMAIGVILHITEHHEHSHSHVLQLHEHPHSHDEHHRHNHDFQWDGTEPHTHPHRHEPMRHSHAHYPDIHHRHEH